MHNKKILKIILNSFAIAFVIGVILVAFFFREFIENYALTGYFGVFVSCIVSTATILLPAPSIFVVIQYAQFLNPVLVLTIGGLGTSLGELLGYVLGRSSNNLLQINTGKRLFKWFKKKPELMVFLFALIPAPVFDIVGIMAGMIKMNPIRFWIPCFLGKVLKFGFYFLVANHLQELIKMLELSK